ncbi:MAG: BLUF domain-containing protein [Flavobacteriia bacterium]|jgi:hypothetical protein
MLQRLIYLSAKTDKFQNNELILKQSKNYNASKEISGILLEYENNFIQYLEGDPIEIYSLFKRIEKDERHTDIWLVDYSAIKQRAFQEWGMGFKRLNKVQIEGWGLAGLASFSSSESFSESLIKNPEVLELIQMIEFSAIKP